MYSQLFKIIWCLWVTFTNQLNHSLPQNLVLRKQIPYNFSTFLSKLGHCFTRFQDRKTKDPFALFVTFDDNSCIVLDPKNGRVISTIYPPPTATSICKVVYSLHNQKVFILLKTGALCLYRIQDKETAVLELMQYPNQIRVRS